MNNFKSKIKYIIKSIIYRLIITVFKFPKTTTINETLDYIIKNKASVSRYGDGELLLLHRKKDIGFQDIDNELSKELKKILKADLPNHIVCIPDVFNGLEKYIKRTRSIWMSLLIYNYKDWYKSFSKDIKYYNAFVTRPYYIHKDKTVADNYFNRWKEVWEGREIVIIEGNKSRLGVGNDLFKNAKSLVRIICPSENAYSIYGKIKNEAKKIKHSKLILIALGPTSTILSYDLHRLGYQAIDIGHLDIEYEWFLRQVNEKVKIENKYTNEVLKGDLVENIKDEEYINQIIADISNE